MTAAGCATPAPGGRPEPKRVRWAESDLDSKAHGAAFSAMFLRTPMPDRSDFRDWEFYFKHCSRVDVDRPYISKTQYDCNGPY